MTIPPGLTCATCEDPFGGRLARRTRQGYVHAGRCPIYSPTELTAGRWVTIAGDARYITQESA